MEFTKRGETFLGGVYSEKKKETDYAYGMLNTRTMAKDIKSLQLINSLFKCHISIDKVRVAFFITFLGR